MNGDVKLVRGDEIFCFIGLNGWTTTGRFLSVLPVEPDKSGSAVPNGDPNDAQLELTPASHCLISSTFSNQIIID